mmetsp:Transcript_39923/g.103001  ORF Transcript_39923/g.103001 Transcript_39923/m.103001 type:complete len:290 (+) Transcript_39923:1774-2643(+)
MMEAWWFIGWETGVEGWRACFVSSLDAHACFPGFPGFLPSPPVSSCLFPSGETRGGDTTDEGWEDRGGTGSTVERAPTDIWEPVKSATAKDSSPSPRPGEMSDTEEGGGGSRSGKRLSTHEFCDFIWGSFPFVSFFFFSFSFSFSFRLGQLCNRSALSSSSRHTLVSCLVARLGAESFSRMSGNWTRAGGSGRRLGVLRFPCASGCSCFSCISSLLETGEGVSTVVDLWFPSQRASFCASSVVFWRREGEGLHARCICRSASVPPHASSVMRAQRSLSRYTLYNFSRLG